jgi:hypothetical protein
MRNYRELLVLLLMITLLILPAALFASQGLSAEAGDEEGILVGRIAHVEGTVSRYVPEEGVWIQVATDFPFGLEDKLRSDNHSRAEVILPNNTWFRMDGDTHLHLLSLQTGKTEMHMVHGSARFMNRGSYSSLYVSTPFGEVSAPAQTSFDLYVGDASMEVVSLKGSVYFSRDGGRTNTEVAEGAASLLADRYAVTAGQGYRDSSWNTWNVERDALWAQRMRAGRVSAKYLPSSLHDHAYALDDYGAWQWAYYDGAYGYLWRPLYVSAGWAPYTTGRWGLWYGDHLWISREPFGYVTHHYGTWVYTGGYWYWAPPVVSLSVHFVHPSLRLGVAWYPGRVAWFHAGTSIGWIPLAPHEPYYAHRRWGPRTVIVKNVTVVNVNVRTYRNERQAVMIDKGKLHASDNYRTASIRTVDRRTLGAKIQAQPAFDRKQSARDPARGSSSIRSRDLDRTSSADTGLGSRNKLLPVSPRTAGQNPLNPNLVRDSSALSQRDTSPPKAPAPRRALNKESAESTSVRTAEKKPVNLKQRAPTTAVQQKSGVGKDTAGDNSRSTVLTLDKAPESNMRQIPAGSGIKTQNRQIPAISRQSSIAPQIGTAAPPKPTPTPARVRPGSDRSAAGSGTPIHLLSQQRQQGLEQARPETDRSPNVRIQGQGVLPDKVSPRSMENPARGRSLDRSSRAAGG